MIHGNRARTQTIQDIMALLIVLLVVGILVSAGAWIAKKDHTTTWTKKGNDLAKAGIWGGLALAVLSIVGLVVLQIRKK